jgi:hypothetical protein
VAGWNAPPPAPPPPAPPSPVAQLQPCIAYSTSQGWQLPMPCN